MLARSRPYAILGIRLRLFCILSGSINLLNIEDTDHKVPGLKITIPIEPMRVFRYSCSHGIAIIVGSGRTGRMT